MELKIIGVWRGLLAASPDPKGAEACRLFRQQSLPVPDEPFAIHGWLR